MSDRPTIVDCVENIRLPAAWPEGGAFDFLQLEAGRAYILDQIGVDGTPEHKFELSRTDCEPTSYEVYDDGSLWFINNAEDEVWVDFREFVSDRLVPGLQAQSPALRWEEDDDPESTVIDDMDRGLLLLFCDGNEEEARELVR